MKQCFVIESHVVSTVPRKVRTCLLGRRIHIIIYIRTKLYILYMWVYIILYCNVLYINGTIACTRPHNTMYIYNFAEMISFNVTTQISNFYTPREMHSGERNVNISL